MDRFDVGMHINFVVPYARHSAEELRLADYAAGWRYPAAVTEQSHHCPGIRMSLCLFCY